MNDINDSNAEMYWQMYWRGDLPGIFLEFKAHPQLDSDVITDIQWVESKEFPKKQEHVVNPSQGFLDIDWKVSREAWVTKEIKVLQIVRKVSEGIYQAISVRCPVDKLEINGKRNPMFHIVFKLLSDKEYYLHKTLKDLLRYWKGLNTVDSIETMNSILKKEEMI